jgi:hypothetical protein
MKVRVISKKTGGGIVKSGLMEDTTAKGVFNLLKKHYPNDDHKIVRSDGTEVRKIKNPEKAAT